MAALFRIFAFFLSTLGVFLTLSGCLAPIALHQAVLEYDQTTAQIQAEILLKNIARSKHTEPLHFTAVSSVAATFNFETSIGLQSSSSNTTDLIAPFFRTTVAENPTITIIPVEGEEFTKRILSPITSDKFFFLALQGIRPGIIFRLLAERLVIIKGDRQRVLQNRPDHEDEYSEFRRRTLHLASLRSSYNTHVLHLNFRQTLPFSIPVSGSDEKTFQLKSLDQIFQAEENGYTLTPDPDKGGGVLSKVVYGPRILTNYPLADLSPQKKQRFIKEIALLPENSLIVDISPEYPGGDYPFTGYYQFRSFQEVLQFVARINSTNPEFDVKPHPKTGPVEANPTVILKIEETMEEPGEAAFKVQHNGLWYWIKKPTATSDPAITWNLETFRALVQLYEMTKADVQTKPSPAITIAK